MSAVFCHCPLPRLNCPNCGLGCYPCATVAAQRIASLLQDEEGDPDWMRMAKKVLRGRCDTPPQPAPPATRVPRQYCTEGCSDYPRCSHASLPPGVLPESMRAAPATPLDALGEPTMAEMVASTKAHIKNLDSVREAGRRTERAAIVAWLGGPDGGTAMANLAMRLERGDHLSTPTEKPPGERR